MTPEIVITPPNNGEQEMADAADIPVQRAELIFTSLGETNESLTHELAADEAGDMAHLRRVAGRKFHETNPLEAAAAETILTLAEG